jgi:ATP-dependent Lon protease
LVVKANLKRAAPKMTLEAKNEHDGKEPGDREIDGSAASLPARFADGLPSTLHILVSPMGPVFPGMMSPIPLLDARMEKTVEESNPFVGVLATRANVEISDSPVEPRSLYEVGCAGRLLDRMRFPDGKPGVVVMCVKRMRVVRFIKSDTVLLAQVEYPEDVVRDQKEEAALFWRLRQSFKELIELSPDIPKEVGGMVDEVDEPGKLADFVAANLGKDTEVKQGILSSCEVDGRLRSALLLVEKDLDLARLGAKLQEEIRSKIESRQKEHFLREQIKAIRKELGEEVDQRELDRQTYLQKIEDARMPEEAEKRARQEQERMSLLPTEASEYHVIRNYLEWLVELPWSKMSSEEMDIGKAARILDGDHHGLKEVKERIVEFLAVRKLRPDQRGAILCLVGPPGVGKTSLGRSVALATGREFHRISLGGMRDEAEIKGHRRTYVGAMPGKIIQGMRRVGTRNPVFMLDELDKLSSDWRGDPSSAMLEVLDPDQNNAFEDLYIDLPFDLSQVMFIATANVSAHIPAPLLDRTEIIELSGYIPQEKLAIGRKFLLPRQLEAHGLTSKHLKIGARAMAAIVNQYTREAGVRGLERTIGRVCRKVAARVAALVDLKKAEQVTLTTGKLTEYLGPRRYFSELVERVKRPGVVVGLAWTRFGGEILFIEATAMPGRGLLQLTGKLGDVMSESARIAHSLIRSRADRYEIPEELLSGRDLHLHVPAGAVPKDGPSAGVAMVCSLLSLLWRGKGKAARARVAMTGEITLRGAVLPVGGIKEKIIGAKRAGIKTVVLPRQNEPDVLEIPAEVLRGLRFVYASRIDEVVEAVLGPIPRA